MATVVVTGSTTKAVVGQSRNQPASIVVKKGGDLTLQSISNVDSTSLQDGYALTYDADTQKFVFAAAPAAASVDGGTY